MKPHQWETVLVFISVSTISTMLFVAGFVSGWSASRSSQTPYEHCVTTMIERDIAPEVCEPLADQKGQ